MSRHAFRPNTSPWGSVYSGIGRDESYGWWWTAGSKERRAGRKEKRVEKLVEKGKGEGSRAERLANGQPIFAKRQQKREPKRSSRAETHWDQAFFPRCPEDSPPRSYRTDLM